MGETMPGPGPESWAGASQVKEGHSRENSRGKGSEQMILLLVLLQARI